MKIQPHLDGGAQSGVLRQQNNTLSVAHKRWTMRVIGLSAFTIVVMLVLLQTAGKIKHRPNVDFQHLCHVEATASLVHELGYRKKANLPSSIAKTHTLQMALSATEQPASVDGAPYTAIMSLCDGSMDVPPQRGAKQCLVKKNKQSSHNGLEHTSRTEEKEEFVSVRYLFAVWNLQGDCVDYFDGTMLHSNAEDGMDGDADVGLTIVRTPRDNGAETNNNNNGSLIQRVELRATFTARRRADSAPTALPAPLHVRIQAGADDAKPEAMLISTAQHPHQYILTVPMHALHTQDEDAARSQLIHRAGKALVQLARHSEANTTTSSSVIGDGDLQASSKRYSIFDVVKFHSLTRDFLMPIVGFIVIPGLVVVVLVLHCRNARLAAAIQKSKKREKEEESDGLDTTNGDSHEMQERFNNTATVAVSNARRRSKSPATSSGSAIHQESISSMSQSSSSDLSFMRERDNLLFPR